MKETPREVSNETETLSTELTNRLERLCELVIEECERSEKAQFQSLRDEIDEAIKDMKGR